MATNRTRPEDESETLRLLRELQRPIQEKLQSIRSEVRVTIGRAAKLTGLSEPKLRELDKQNIVIPSRSNEQPDGQRQYSQSDLEKLAIIGILLERGKRVQDLPANIDTLWNDVLSQKAAILVEKQASDELSAQHKHINQRIESERKALFWRYYASHALRIALALIREDIQNTPVGLVLPLQEYTADSLPSIRELFQLGPSLIGWLSKSGSSHTMLTTAPAFEYPTDYTLLPLTAIEDENPQAVAKDATYIILDRRDKRESFTLSALSVETIRLLLSPLYKNRFLLSQYFSSGMRDALEPATNLEVEENYGDIILNDFADMIVQFGDNANSTTYEPRWSFCCILLAKDRSLPLQQQTLMVRAQSKGAPYQVGKTQVSPGMNAVSLSLRAFQGAHITYRAVNVSEEQVVAYQEMETTMRSAIGIPIGGEDGIPIGSMYIASQWQDAFSEEDQRILRLFTRMIEELLRTYEVRRLAVQNLKELVRHPAIVDQSFEDFASENDFIQDVEAVLQSLYDHHIGGEIYNRSGEVIKEIEQLDNDVLSCIAIDIDQHSVLAAKYGNMLVHNLYREVGLRIRNILYSTGLITQDAVLYHICADRFYIVFKENPFQQVKARAIRLKNELDGAYKVSIRYSALDQTVSAGNLQEVNISVRLAVSSYTIDTLVRNLKHHTIGNAVAAFRVIIEKTLEERLKKGMSLGGNVIISWNPQLRRAEPLTLIQ